MRSLLIVSGLDPSGGAGFVADVRVAERHGARAVGVVTALTEQTTAGVRAVHPVAAELIEAQLSALLADVEVAGGKIGLLPDEEVAEAVAQGLALTRAPVVWDPILWAGGSGAPMFQGRPARLFELLGDHVTLVTPNLAEAGALVGFEVATIEDMKRAALAVAERGVACLVKGGHLGGGGGARVVDVLASEGAVLELEGVRVAGGEAVHGTGCALSSAIAARLSRGDDLEEAVCGAAEFVRERIAAPEAPGRGERAVL